MHINLFPLYSWLVAFFQTAGSVFGTFMEMRGCWFASVGLQNVWFGVPGYRTGLPAPLWLAALAAVSPGGGSESRQTACRPQLNRLQNQNINCRFLRSELPRVVRKIVRQETLQARWTRTSSGESSAHLTACVCSCWTADNYWILI